MSVAAGEYRPKGAQSTRRSVVLASLVVGAAFVLLSVAVVHGSHLRLAAVPLAMLICVVALHKRLFAWHSLIALILLVILFVPIRRYTLPSALPFNLELYRIVVAGVVICWVSSLLIDRRVRVRSSGMDGPLGAFALAILISVVVNVHRVESVGPFFTKLITLFASFLVVFYLLVSVIKRPREIDFLVRILVGGGAVLGVSAIIEQRFNYHAFNHINSVLPFLEYHDVQLATAAERGGQLRVYASSQHPIAMGAAFALLLPLAVYCVRTWGRRWWLATALIIFGAVATQSRSAVVMLFVIAIVYVGLHPRETARLWPLVLPALVIIHFAVPGNLGSIKDSFFPKGGLVAEQADKPVGSGRLATLGPVLRDEFLPNPIVGEGFATRITVSEPGLAQNAPITDDEWLDLLAQTGILGVLAFLWVFVRSVRGMWRPAKRDPSARGWLLAGATASIVAYGVSMLTYDAFSFIQVTFLFFIILSIGAVTLLTSTNDWEQFARDRARAHCP